MLKALWERTFEFLTQGQFLGVLIGAIIIVASRPILRRINLFGSSLSTPISHKVAVLGLPKAGKTTLITAMFELIQKGVPRGDVRLHGTETIYAVNRNIMQLASGEVIGPAPGVASSNVSKLMSGEAIGPTSERDIFVFRFSYVRTANWLRKLLIIDDVYDVEIADFPGEYTDKLERGERGSAGDIFDGGQIDFGGALFKREFFSWIASSREYVFLIDLAQIYSSNDVRKSIAELTARIRTSWQVIEDATSDRGIGNPRKRPVHLVFTKLDALLPLSTEGFSLTQLQASADDFPEAEQIIKVEDAKDMVRLIAQQSNLSNSRTLSQELVKRIMFENESCFSDLISFFQARVGRVDTVYSSMIIRDEAGNRLGVEKILLDILP